jgi:uncharacterized protein
LAALALAVIVPDAARAQATEQFYRVANTRPPDAYVSLRSQPSSSAGQRLDSLSNGTLLRVLEKRPNGWWRLQVVSNGKQGWALSGQRGRSWIVCCTSAVSLPKVETSVALSPAALKKLVDSGEYIHFAVEIFGNTGKRDPEEMPGDITLASQEFDIAPGQKTAIGGTLASQQDLAAVRPMIWMNVYSSRRVFSDNLLNCDLVQQAWSDLVAAGDLTIKCSLIGEPNAP